MKSERVVVREQGAVSENGGTLLVNSKMPGKAVLHMMFEVQKG
jgi:hypothetical protein